MKIEVGMYVRTKYRHEVVIRKIVNIYEDTEAHDHVLVFDKPTKYQYYVEDNYFIAKEKLIDLIQEGDYVNGKEIEQIINNELYFEASDMASKISFKEKDIKTIVTKEQFESISYKVD